MRYLGVRKGIKANRAPADMTDPMITPSLRGFKADWKRDGSVWEAFRRSCPTDSPSRRLVESVRSAESGVGAALQVQGRVTSKLGAPTTRRQSTGQAIPSARELTFNKDLDASFDICAVPSMHSLHSTFFSDQRSIEYLYPVFSPSKPAGYADILIPSHHYWTPGSEFTYEWELKRGLTKAPTDHEWSDKKSTIYWRGKVTRGADTPPGHASSFQKQRLVKMANEVSPSARRVLVDFDDQTAALTSISAPVTAVNKAVSDIAMACDPSLGECAYLRSLGYRVEPPAPLSEAWKHKYVLDLDEIGFSPRFLALMESKSAVVKSSVQREFWKGWVVPWFVSQFFLSLVRSDILSRSQEALHSPLVRLRRALQHSDLFQRVPRRPCLGGIPRHHVPHSSLSRSRASSDGRWTSFRGGSRAAGYRRGWA